MNISKHQDSLTRKFPGFNFSDSNGGCFCRWVRKRNGDATKLGKRPAPDGEVGLQTNVYALATTTHHIPAPTTCCGNRQAQIQLLLSD